MLVDPDRGDTVEAGRTVPALRRPATISASVGVTAFEPGDDADSLLSRADAAMYAAKRSGGGRCVLAE
jgi:PleD family two-component response regulator